MNILVTTDSNYLQHAYAMLVSLLENNDTRHVDLYYIHYDIDDASIDRFKKFFSQYNMTVTFLKYDFSKIAGLKICSHVSHAAYLRIISPDILPEKISRILYLDPDIIVRKSLTDLYDTDLGDSYFGAVDNYDPIICRNPLLNIPEGYNYFNSGVMLIDVEKFRRDRIHEKTLDFAKTMGPEFGYHDQDALNATLYDKWICLHPRWNVHTRIVQVGRWNSGLHIQEIREAITDPAIIHFASIPKPWEYVCTNPFCGDYWHYLKKTPYKELKPVGFSYPNMIRKSLSKVIIYCIPKTIKDLVPSTFKNKIKNLIQKSNENAAVIVSE